MLCSIPCLSFVSKSISGTSGVQLGLWRSQPTGYRHLLASAARLWHFNLISLHRNLTLYQAGYIYNAGS
jgi:hypothetical protein